MRVAWPMTSTAIAPPAAAAGSARAGAAAIETPEELAQRVARNLRARGFEAQVVPTKERALEAVLALLPAGAAVMTGGSTTLEQLGLPQALRERGHRYLKDEVGREPDAARRARLRREATLADWFLGSVNALTEDGVLVAADGSGSRIGAYAFGAGRVVIVASLNKVAPTLEQAMARVREVALPLEDARMKRLGAPGTAIGSWLLMERAFGGRVHVVLVGEPLGF